MKKRLLLLTLLPLFVLAGCNSNKKDNEDSKEDTTGGQEEDTTGGQEEIKYGIGNLSEQLKGNVEVSGIYSKTYKVPNKATGTTDDSLVNTKMDVRYTSSSYYMSTQKLRDPKADNIKDGPIVETTYFKDADGKMDDGSVESDAIGSVAYYDYDIIKNTITKSNKTKLDDNSNQVYVKYDDEFVNPFSKLSENSYSIQDDSKTKYNFVNVSDGLSVFKLFTYQTFEENEIDSMYVEIKDNKVNFSLKTIEYDEFYAGAKTGTKIVEEYNLEVIKTGEKVVSEKVPEVKKETENHKVLKKAIEGLKGATSYTSNYDGKVGYNEEQDDGSSKKIEQTYKASFKKTSDTTYRVFDNDSGIKYENTGTKFITNSDGDVVGKQFVVRNNKPLYLCDDVMSSFSGATFEFLDTQYAILEDKGDLTFETKNNYIARAFFTEFIDVSEISNLLEQVEDSTLTIKVDNSNATNPIVKEINYNQIPENDNQSSLSMKITYSDIGSTFIEKDATHTTSDLIDFGSDFDWDTISKELVYGTYEDSESGLKVEVKENASFDDTQDISETNSFFTMTIDGNEVSFTSLEEFDDTSSMDQYGSGSVEYTKDGTSTQYEFDFWIATGDSQYVEITWTSTDDDGNLLAPSQYQDEWYDAYLIF